MRVNASKLIDALFNLQSTRVMHDMLLPWVPLFSHNVDTVETHDAILEETQSASLIEEAYPPWHVPLVLVDAQTSNNANSSGFIPLGDIPLVVFMKILPVVSIPSTIPLSVW